MRKDMKERHNSFVMMIMELCASERGCDFEGYSWAAQSQPEWCELLNLSDRTLRSLATHPPVVRAKTVTSEGKPIVLYRIGEAPHMSPRHLANTMAVYFRKKLQLPSALPRSQWGCLFGLAEVWPDGHQIEIFKTVISHWEDFMAAVKGYCSEQDYETYAGRYYKFPVIKLIRKYPGIGLEMRIAKLQHDNDPVPPSLIAKIKLLEKEA